MPTQLSPDSHRHQSPPSLRAESIEVLGAVGLILPVLLRMLPFLTLWAAVGLLVEMVAATTFTLIYVDASMAVFPLVAAVLCAFVAYGRWRVVPLGSRMHPTPPLAGT